jgi:hypothetical protein
MRKRIASLGLGALFLMPSAAIAGKLATGAVFSGTGDDLVCMLSNVGGDPLGSVNVQAKDGAGATVDATTSSTDCAATLAAGASCFLAKTLDGSQRVRCEFRFDGDKIKARGVMVLDDGTHVLTLDAH